MTDERDHVEPPELYWLRWVPDEARGFMPSGPGASLEGESDWRRFVPEEWRHLLAASPAPRPQSRTLDFLGVDEKWPAQAWRALFAQTWGAYRTWWLGEAAKRPTREDAEAKLAEHMPELVSVHARLVELAGGDDVAATMLTLWNPPPFIVACSQVVVNTPQSGDPVLIRNYDYDPRLFEATVYRSRWVDRRVIGTGDCLWGLVDGMNDSGVAVSLTFGGRREVGEGFGVPLVVRYVLEVCADVDEAVAVLRRLPHQISYNITVCDRSGAAATIYVSPDRPALVTDHRQTTNHPQRVEWPEHAAWVRSVERLELLEDLQTRHVDPAEMISRMVAPPLLARQWDAGFATLYTAAYRPATGELTYHWPRQSEHLSLDRPLPAHFAVTPGDPD